MICKGNVLIRGLEVKKIIPFPGRSIQFPVLKISFECLGKNEKYFVKEFFYQRPGKEFHFLFKIIFKLIGGGLRGPP